MEKTIVLVTTSYPTRGITEAAFIEPELVALSCNFDRVIIVPLLDYGEPLDVKFHNVEVDYTLSRHRFSKCKLSKFPLLFSPFLLRNLGSIIKFCSGVKSFFKHCFFYVNTEAFSRMMKLVIKKNGLHLGSTVFYTFWFDYPTSALAEMSKDNDMTIISRSHRYDLYENQGIDRPLQLRQETLAHIKQLYVVSIEGLNYLKTIYPESGHKISVRYLGSAKVGNPDFITESNSQNGRELTFLSVSRVSPEKAVTRNFDFVKAVAMKYPLKTVRWLHIGDGPEMAKLKQHCASDKAIDNLQVEFYGALSNREVHEIYHKEKIDWVLLFSDSEGLPITICESLSYGVPVIANAVGGVPEIVSPEVGILVNRGAQPEIIADAVGKYIDNPSEYMKLKENAFKRWSDMFKSDCLRNKFALELLSLLQG